MCPSYAPPASMGIAYGSNSIGENISCPCPQGLPALGMPGVMASQLLFFTQALFWKFLLNNRLCPLWDSRRNRQVLGILCL